MSAIFQFREQGKDPRIFRLVFAAFFAGPTQAGAVSAQPLGAATTALCRPSTAIVCAWEAAGDRGVPARRHGADAPRDQGRSAGDRARGRSPVGLFLLARMLYTDGMVAILAYAGIYAAGTSGWDLAALLLFGVALTPFAIAGGLLGGWIDNRYGSRTAILVSVGTTAVGMLTAVGVTPTQLFHGVPYDAAAAGPIWSFPYFRTLPELIFFGIFAVLSATVTAGFSNSRAMMARIAPLEHLSQFFGIYALSGTATAFLGHGLVAAFTRVFHSQRAGFASTVILLTAGLLLMRWVREEHAP